MVISENELVKLAIKLRPNSHVLNEKGHGK